MRQPVPFGKYLLLERISVGGMAEVFKAKAFGVEGFEKILAIKRILPSMAEDADFIQMFIDEAKISGQLNHANIAQIFELGRVDDSHFIAMEYVWGKDLLQIQNRFRRMKKTMPFDMAAYCVAKMCEGLDYAHKKKDAAGKLLNIIHRDVSPQNVLVSYDGEVKVIDFGIAKAASRSTKTQAGVLKGKFGYMSPEQVRGLPLDRRSDVFAIATILYELLTAERLFLGESDFATLEKVRNVDIPPPSKVVKGCPPAIEKIILKGLAKECEDRYQWASEMNEDLLQYLATLDPPFTIKNLAAWMREQFSAEMKRESQVLEEQKKLSREMKPGAAAPPAAELSPAEAEKLSTIEELDVDLAQEEEAAPLAGEATQISTEMPPEVLAAIAARDAAEGAKPLASESTQILSDKHPAPTDLLAQSTRILDTAGPGNGAAPAGGLPPLAGQSTVMLEAPSYPPPRPIPTQTSKDPITGQTGINPRTDAVDRLPYRPPKRSTLARDLTIGVLVAALVVGGVLGGRHFLAGKPVSTLVVTVAPAGAAKVMVDGVDKGQTTPAGTLTLKNLAVGAHMVVVEGEGGKFEQSVVLAANDVSVLTAALAGAPVAEKPTRTTTAAELTKAGGKAIGKLKLNITNEGATVFIDDAQLEEGAWKDPIPLPGGVEHQFKVTKQGFEAAKFAVTVGAGEEQTKEVTLAAATGHIEIKTDPAGADVNVNGKSIGQSPAKVDDLDVGKQARVTIRKSGYSSVTKYVSFDKDNHQALEVKLASASAGSSGSSGSSGDDGEPAVATKKGDEGGGEHAKKDEPKGEKGEPKGEAKGDAPKGDAPAGTGDGFLVANTQPWAKVLIDGKDTGKTTPIAPRSKIPLKPGKHKVTFVANGKKYDFDIQVKPGEDFRLIKQLGDSP